MTDEILSTEEYQTADGRSARIIHQRSGQYEQWLWECEGLQRGGYCWSRREKCIADLERSVFIAARRPKLAEIGARTREAYERLCRETGIEMLSDEEILHASYAMKHGDYFMDHYTGPACLRGYFAQARFEALEQQAEKERIAARMAAATNARPAPTVPEKPAMICRECRCIGQEGAYPFSTNPASGLCDDCGA